MREATVSSCSEGEDSLQHFVKGSPWPVSETSKIKALKNCREFKLEMLQCTEYVLRNISQGLITKKVKETP